MSGQNSNITYPSITLKKMEGVVKTKVSISFKNTTYSSTLSVPKALYEGARTSTRSVRIPESKAGVDWSPGYYNAFIFDSSQSNLYSVLLSMFRNIRDELSLDEDEYLELLTKYVQSMPYDEAKLRRGNDGPKYPVETIVENTGVCSDKSILLAALLSHEGYAVALLSFKNENHMTVGIPVGRGQGYKKSGYAIIESTNLNYVGEEPENLRGVGSLMSTPRIFPVGNGKKLYHAMKEVNSILNTREELKRRIDTNGVLSLKIKTMRKESDKRQKVIDDLGNIIKRYEKQVNELSSREYEKYSAAVDTYNMRVQEKRAFVDELNALVGKYNQMVEVSNGISENVHERKKILQEIRKIGF